MNREEFLHRLQPTRVPTRAGLEPYAARLDQRRALHLLRRATFGATPEAARRLTGLTAAEAVRLLLDNAAQAPAPEPPAWADEAFLNPERKPAAERPQAYDAIFKAVYQQNYQLKEWWQVQMRQDTLSLREKMTLFWHGHFSTKFAINAIQPAPLMYRQNALFRRMHQGNFKALAEAVTLDGAMLVFLNGQENSRQAPNENYSRELLELYTTGIGHYTEADVREGSRLLTGWRTNFYRDENLAQGVFRTFFLANQHDPGEKTYLGVRFPPTTDTSEEAVGQNQISRMIEVILTQRGAAVGRFLAEKLYRFFVYANPAVPEESVLNGLAETFRKSGFQLRPVLEQLLTSAHFFDEANQGVQLKTPAEYVTGLSQHFNVAADWKRWVMDTMGQELFNPPDVSGWPGYRQWFTTRSFPFAVQQGGGFIWSQKDEDLLAWAKRIPDYTDATRFIEGLGQVLLARPLDGYRTERYRKILLAGAPDYEWPALLRDAGTVTPRIKALLITLVKAPDFHLC